MNKVIQVLPQDKEIAKENIIEPVEENISHQNNIEIVVGHDSNQYSSKADEIISINNSSILEYSQEKYFRDQSQEEENRIGDDDNEKIEAENFVEETSSDTNLNVQDGIDEILKQVAVLSENNSEDDTNISSSDNMLPCHIDQECKQSDDYLSKQLTKLNKKKESMVDNSKCKQTSDDCIQKSEDEKQLTSENSDSSSSYNNLLSPSHIVQECKQTDDFVNKQLTIVSNEEQVMVNAFTNTNCNQTLPHNQTSENINKQFVNENMLISEEITHHEPIVEDGKTEFNVSNMKLLKNTSRPNTNSKPIEVNTNLLQNPPSDQKYLEKITTKLLSKEEISKMIPATHHKKCKKKEKNRNFSKKFKSSDNDNSVVEFPKLLKLKIPENCKQTASGYVNKKPVMMYPKLTYYQGSLIKDNNGTGFLRETEIPEKNLATYKVGQYDDYLNHAAGPGSMNNFATFQFNIRKEMDKKLQESNEKILNRKINASTNTDFKKQVVEDCDEQQQNVEKWKQTADILTETTDNCNQIDDFIENKTMVVVEKEHNILEREIKMSKLVQKTRENEIVLPIIEITPPKAEIFKHMNNEGEKISEIPFYSRKRSIVIKLPSYDTLDESELKQVHNTTEIIEEGQNEIEVENNTEKNGIEFNEQDFNAESDHNYSEDYESEDAVKYSETEENYRNAGLFLG